MIEIGKCPSRQPINQQQDTVASAADCLPLRSKLWFYDTGLVTQLHFYMQSLMKWAPTQGCKRLAEK